MKMGKRRIRQGDIVDATADAIVFSSNEHLFLSGGAGASLLGLHGDPLQKAMHRALAITGKKVAQRGSVFEIEPAETWSSRLFAVVAADGFYETSKDDTRSALERVLSCCAELPEVKTVATTALGTGYGNMEIEDFVEIFCGIEVPASIESFELVIHGDVFFRYACQRNERLANPAYVG
jgi:O-acetyl-ADP-ribose deacetylase (regulator of RNase III)